MSTASANEPMEVVVEEDEIRDLDSAVKKVLRNSHVHQGLVRGLHQVSKVLDNKKAQVCFLANSCSEPTYKKLVELLCREKGVPLVAVEDGKDLGRYAGLCSYDKDGEPHKIVGASCVAITDFGEDSEALEFLHKHIKSIKS